MGNSTNPRLYEFKVKKYDKLFIFNTKDQLITDEDQKRSTKKLSQDFKIYKRQLILTKEQKTQFKSIKKSPNKKLRFIVQYEKFML